MLNIVLANGSSHNILTFVSLALIIIGVSVSIFTIVYCVFKPKPSNVKFVFLYKLKNNLTDPRVWITMFFTLIFGLVCRYLIQSFLLIDVTADISSIVSLVYYCSCIGFRRAFFIWIEGLNLGTTKLYVSADNTGISSGGAGPSSSGAVPSSSSTGPSSSSIDNSGTNIPPVVNDRTIFPRMVVTDPFFQVENYHPGASNQPFMGNLRSALEDQYKNHRRSTLTKGMFDPATERYMLLVLADRRPDIYARITSGCSLPDVRWSRVYNTKKFRDIFS